MDWTYGPTNVLPSFAGSIEVDAESAPFWQGLAEGDIRVPRCENCSNYRFPPGPYCLSCGSSMQRFVTLTGRPRLFSWIVVNRSTHRSMPAPYVVAVLEYDEGVRLPAALHVPGGVDALTLGMPVVATVVQGDPPFIAGRVPSPQDPDLDTRVIAASQDG